MSIEKKLAAIMFTDIAGYTESMSKDEVFVVLGGTTGNGGVASLTFAKNDAGLMTFKEKWQTPPNDEYNLLHINCE